MGRIIPSKAYDVLLAALRDIPEDVGVYIISGQATPDLQALVDQYQIKNVHFVDFMPKQRLWKYYRMADFLALPTRIDTWGLFVNEAMANGLPVITTDRCVAGLELIEDYENGFIVKVNDVLDLQNKIHLLLADKEMREKMAANNVKKIRWYTFEEQARVTLDALDALPSVRQSKK